MKNREKNSIGYKIKDLFTDDQIGTTPNENRLFIVGLLPAALGLTGGGMSLYLSIFPADKNNIAMVPGFALAIIFGWFAQISMRRAFQMKDRDRRVMILRRMQIIPPISIGLAFIGLTVSLVVWYFPPHAASEVFFTLAGVAILFPSVGVLLTPFAFAARRIGWLVNPR